MLGSDLALFLLGTDNRVLDVRFAMESVDIFELGKIVYRSVREAQGACSRDRMPRRNKLLALFALSNVDRQTRTLGRLQAPFSW